MPLRVPGRLLAGRARALQHDIGEGPLRRPSTAVAPAFEAFVADALEAMAWVADKRGFGGARALDGLA